MTPFIELSSGARSVFCTVSILLFVGFIINTIQAVNQRRIAYTIESVIEFFAPYFLFNVCAEVSDYYLGGELDSVAGVFARLPYGVFIIAFILLAILFFVRFYFGEKYRKNHITPSAIKEAADGMPTGFCYYNKNGHPFLTNSTMNRLAVAITGKPLTNGITFSQLVMAENIREFDGTVYHFSTRTLKHKRDTIYEILADDVTELYQKTRELKENNKQLRANNAKMKAYGERINDTVRREEILKSKVSIHNEMNKLLLQTDNAISIKAEADRQRVLDTWMQNTILLCLEASERSENPLADLYKLAKLIGVTIHINNEPRVDNINALRLFVFVSEEAMTNAVKHAGAKHFYINITQRGNTILATYTNDGLSPAGEIKESGGLKELRRRIELVNGKMNIQSNPYSLDVEIPLEDECYI